HFLGAFDDRATYRAVVRRALAFVLPSEWEAFGLVLLEAMAAGVPIVATSVGAIPEVLGGGAAGLIVPYDDPSSLAGALERLAHDAELRERLVVAATARVEGLTWDRSAAAMRTVYGELTSRA